LITSPSRSVWLERLSAPVVEKVVADYVGADLVRNDDLFNAALVSFGSFGLIHGVLVKTAPMYQLAAYRRLISPVDALWQCLVQLDFSGNAFPQCKGGTLHHVQALMNPYDLARGAYTTVMYEVNACPADARSPSNSSFDMGDSLIEVVGKLTDLSGEITIPFAKLLEHVEMTDTKPVCGPRGDIFSDTTSHGKTASTGMGIPLDRVEEAMGIATKLIVQANAPTLLALRLVKKTTATLGFTRHDPVTAVVEVDGPRSARVQDLYASLWKAFDATGIPYTFHWGKMNNLATDPSIVRRMYGVEVDRWLSARRFLLPTQTLRRAFSNDFTDQLRLSD
jgi:hypothetical protein